MTTGSERNNSEHSAADGLKELVGRDITIWESWMISIKSGRGYRLDDPRSKDGKPLTFREWGADCGMTVDWPQYEPSLTTYREAFTKPLGADPVKVPEHAIWSVLDVFGIRDQVENLDEPMTPEHARVLGFNTNYTLRYIVHSLSDLIKSRLCRQGKGSQQSTVQSGLRQFENVPRFSLEVTSVSDSAQGLMVAGILCDGRPQVGLSVRVAGKVDSPSGRVMDVTTFGDALARARSQGASIVMSSSEASEAKCALLVDGLLARDIQKGDTLESL